MKPFLLILLSYSLSTNLLGQPFALEGIVLSSNDEPLPFATLSIAGGTRGTITNANGQFRLVLKEEDRYDSLRVSFVGYYSKIIELGSINLPDRNRGYRNLKLNIELVEKVRKLDEVVITSLTAEKVLENSLNNIPDNFYSQPYSSKGFYRMYSKKNDKYVHLSEAVFDLYRSKDPEEVDQFRLDTWRGITDRREAHGTEVGVRPAGIFGMDEVNSKEFLKTFGKKKFLKEHRCTMEGEYMYDNRPVYLISFDQKEGIRDLGFKGQFYIDKEDFAFLEIDYGLSPKSIQHYKFRNVAYRALLELFGVDIKLLSSRSRIRYQKIGKRYYLKDASGNNNYHLKSDRSYYNFILNTKMDYAVSEIKLENPEKFTNEETMSHGKVIEKQNVAYDSLFWQDHTIILPESDFGKISSAIAENNRANDTKNEIEDQLRKFPKEPHIRVDSIIALYHKKGLFHGNALVAYNDEVTLNKSFPYSGQDLELDSRFRIGSTSKTFTSILILMLEKEGRLSLSDSISKYIPDYRNGEVTIAQLLSHQSGIPNYLSKHEDILDVYKESYTIDDLIKRFCSDTLEFEPGSDFRYSNSGYVLLAKIAEVVGKKSFAQLLSEKIFDPLEMHNTSFGMHAENPPHIKGYYYGQPEVSYPFENVIGAGGVVSTTEDLLKWSKALESGDMIERTLVEKAIVPRVEYKDWEAYYGYGWMIDQYFFDTSKKHKIIYHPGTDMAFYSMFLKQPDEQITIVLLSNTGDFPRFEMTDLILEVLN